MGKKLKENSFIEGTMIAYFAIIITKILGLVYVIPLYPLLGSGKYIYICAYKLYNLISNASTSGIPTAMSIIISEYNTKGRQNAKRKAYQVGFRVVSVLSISIFLIIQIFANQIAKAFEVNSTSIAEIATGYRIVSVCLLFAPFLSVVRGYFQGHKLIAHSSYSQIIEQFVRIGFVLGGAYLAIFAFKLNNTVAVYIALAGAAVGAALSLLYMQITKYKHASYFNAKSNDSIPLTKNVIRKILFYSIPVVIVAISNDIYELLDFLLIGKGLEFLQFPGKEIEIILGDVTTWCAKICMVITALSMGLTASIVPNISSSYAKRDYLEVNKKFNLSVQTIIVISTPIALGIMLLSEPVFTMFFSKSEYGTLNLPIYAVVAVLSSIKIVMCMALQGMGKAKLVITSVLASIATILVLDIVFIFFLFPLLGIPAWLGGSCATIIGHLVNILMISKTLRKEMRFRYRPIKRTIFRVFFPNLLMVAVVFVISRFILVIPTDAGKLVIAIYLAIYGAIGAIIYFLYAYKTKAIGEVFGDNFLKKILKKIKK